MFPSTGDDAELIYDASRAPAIISRTYIGLSRRPVNLEEAPKERLFTLHTRIVYSNEVLIPPCIRTWIRLTALPERNVYQAIIYLPLAVRLGRDK